MQSIKVKHNVEMAHRLYETPGKCEAIHGHSWWVELEIAGEVQPNGQILEFGDVKRKFRRYLDAEFDHRVLLNEADPWASSVRLDPEKDVWDFMPGLAPFYSDPTTENFAAHIGKWAREKFGLQYNYRVTVWETSVNAATWEG